MEEEQDIQSDIVKQKQLRDAQENQEFDRDMDAYRRGKELTDEQRKKVLLDNARKRQLLGSQLLDNIGDKFTEFSSSVMEAAQDDPDTWTDDAIRIGLGGLKNVGTLLSAPGIKQLTQLVGAPAYYVGRGLGYGLEKAGVDPRYGHIAGEVGEWFIPGYGMYKATGKIVKGAKALKGLSTIDNLSPSVAAARRGPLSPSSGDIENIESVLNPERLTRIKNLKNELLEQTKPFIEESRANIAATKNPYLPQRTRVELAGVSKYSGYERGGTFRYKKFKEHQKNMEQQGRSWLGIFQAGFTGAGASRAVPFNQFRHFHKQRLLEEFGPTLQAMGITESSLQIHHIAALKSIMGIFDGLQLNSRMYRQVSETILKEIPGLGLGDMLGNLKPVVGKTSDVGTPHYLVHKFYNDRLGKIGQGEDFFTEKVLRRMKVDPSYRLEKAKEIGEVIRESEKIVTQAQKVYKTLYAQSTTLDEVLEVMSELNDKGMINLFDEKYQVDKVKEIIETIVNDIEINGFPTELGPAWWQEAKEIKKILKKPTKRGSGQYKSIGNKNPRQIRKTYKKKSKDK